MKKLLSLAFLLTGCNLFNPSTPSAEAVYKPQTIDVNYPIRILWVRPLANVQSSGSNPNFVVPGWSFFLVNTSDSDFVPYNWRIRTANNRERIYSILGNNRAVIPARGSVSFQGVETNFLDTANSFATLVSSDGKEIQTVRWERNGNGYSNLGFPKPPKTPFMLFRVLPNPEGNDDGREEIFVQNISDTAASVTNWKIRSTSGSQEQLFQATAPIPAQSIALFQYNIRAWLNNVSDTVQIVNPQGRVVHWITWKNAKEAQYIYAQP